MIIPLLISFVLAQSPCDGVQPSKDLSNLYMKRWQEAPNLSAIANEADSVLSKLTAAKSPVLLSWLKKRNLMLGKEEEIAKQWRTYYFNDYIIANFPTSNTQVNNTVNRLYKDWATDFFPEKEKAFWEEAFTAVKQTFQAAVASWPLKPSARKSISKDLEKAELSWLEDLSTSNFQQDPKSFFNKAAQWNFKNLKLQLGLQARTLTQTAQKEAFLTYTLSQLFTPCQWSQKQSMTYPFADIVMCLRSEKSIQAKKGGRQFIDDPNRRALLKKDELAFYQKNLHCPYQGSLPHSEQVEQINEAFAHWMAAEVFRPTSSQWPRPDLCHKKAETLKPVALFSGQALIAKIYLAQPAWAKAFKTKGHNHHCGFPKPVPTQ